MILTFMHGLPKGKRKVFRRENIIQQIILGLLILAGAISSDSHKSDQITSNVDLKPTLLDLCGLKHPQEDIDGWSIADYISGDKKLDRTLFWHSPRARLKSTGDNFCTVIREGDYKLFSYYKENRVELYNLKDDPFESHDISVLNKEIVENLQQQVFDWRLKVDAVK